MRPAALPVALPFLAAVAAGAARSPTGSAGRSPPRGVELGAERPALLLDVAARKTWRYFETFAGAEDHWLPPDNFQEVPEPRVAHRTSPTNIGLGLLATLAAHDLGFIDADELVERTRARRSTTIEGLERHEGHLLNWYDTQTPGAARCRATSRRSTAATSPAR